MVQVKLMAPGKGVKWLVIPTIRRKDIIDVTQRGLVGGHYSINKTSANVL